MFYHTRNKIKGNRPNSLHSKKQIMGSAFSTESHEKASKDAIDNYNRKSLNITF